MKKIILIVMVLGLCFNAFGQTKTTKKGSEKVATPTPKADKQISTQSDDLKTSSPMTEEVSTEEANAKMLEYMTPGMQHAYLAGYVGDWVEEISLWTSEKSDPTISSAKCTIEMIMGGRYLKSTHKGEFFDMPFEGTGTIGYDNAMKVFNSTWIDNMGTGTMYTVGQIDPKTNNLVLRGEQVDYLSGKMIKIREVYTKATDSGWAIEMYTTPLNGKEFKSMQINFSK